MWTRSLCLDKKAETRVFSHHYSLPTTQTREESSSFSYGFHLLLHLYYYCMSHCSSLSYMNAIVFSFFLLWATRGCNGVTGSARIEHCVCKVDARQSFSIACAFTISAHMFSWSLCVKCLRGKLSIEASILHFSVCFRIERGECLILLICVLLVKWMKWISVCVLLVE